MNIYFSDKFFPGPVNALKRESLQYMPRILRKQSSLFLFGMALLLHKTSVKGFQIQLGLVMYKLHRIIIS